MKPAEIRGKSEKEWVKILGEKKAMLFGLKLKLRMGQLAKTAELQNTKKDIARILTIANEKGTMSETTKQKTATVKKTKTPK